MKLKSAFPGVFFTGVACIATACSPPGAVQEPTWADDVYPILQGQCLHCHADTYEKNKAVRRLDFLNVDVCADLATSVEAIANAGSILQVVDKKESDTDVPLMPPAPARPLEDWQIETIRRWTEGDSKRKIAKYALGKPTNNHSPTLTVQTKVSGSTLTLSYVASDSDGDPVLGEIKVGDNLWHRFSSTGSGRVTFDLANETGKLQITARLCDGWKLVSLDGSDGLKTVDAK